MTFLTFFSSIFTTLGKRTITKKNKTSENPTMPYKLCLKINAKLLLLWKYFSTVCKAFQKLQICNIICQCNLRFEFQVHTISGYLDFKVVCRCTDEISSPRWYKLETNTKEITSTAKWGMVTSPYLPFILLKVKQILSNFCAHHQGFPYWGDMPTLLPLAKNLLIPSPAKFLSSTK